MSYPEQCDHRDAHDAATDTPTGRRCEATGTHLIRWQDGRYSVGCESHLKIDDVATVRPQSITPLHAARRFFLADNQGVTYSFVALDVDHCRAMLVRHGCVFYAPDGGETYDIERAAIEWSEITPEQAAIRMTSDDGQEAPALHRLPLSQRALGDWFCSEH